MIYSIKNEDDEEIGSIDSGKYPMAWKDTEAIFQENADVYTIVTKQKEPLRFRVEDGMMVASRTMKVEV
jgi:hypothetical protein